MFRNYLVIILRNLIKQKLFSFINIFGLSLAIAISILVILFIRNELSYDRFHQQADRIYRPYTHASTGEREATNVHTPFIMGRQLKDNYPEITAYTMLTAFNERVMVMDQAFEETIHVGSADFFRIFSFPSIYGRTENALNDPDGIIITRKFAEKYFGRLNVINERMRIPIGGEEKDFTIRAVLEDMPSNSSIRFNLLVGDHHLKDLFPEPMLTSWHMITGETYILLNEGVDPDALEPKFASLVRQVIPEDLDRMEFNIHLQPLTDIHLNNQLPAGNAPVSDPKYMVILISIALLILIIASINFIMLSLGRSFMRAKEIGIRKSTGATKTQIMIQFLGESSLLALFGLILGIVLVFLSLPWFNEFTNQHLTFTFTPVNMGLYLALTLLTGLLAGSYPAMIMSGFKPANILRGKLKVNKGNNVLGSFLVTGQFVLFIILIGCALIFRSQLHYMQNKNLGYDKENVMYIPMNTEEAKGVREVVTKGFAKARVFEEAVKQMPQVLSTGISSHIFEQGRWTQIGYETDGNETRDFYYNTIDPGYLPTLDIQLLKGRNFTNESPSDKKRSVIVNESFVKAFDLNVGIGERIPHEAFEDHEIIGIVQDFHIHSLHAEIPPLMLAMNADLAFSGANNINIGSSVRPKLLIRLRNEDLTSGITAIESAFKKIFPGESFDYQFIDQSLKSQYENEQNLGKVVTSASLLSVIIGCLGLFGLSILAFNSRLKEISIRKVLGAPSIHLLFMLSKKFIILLILALILSIPVTSTIMSKWLSEFEYKIRISPVFFILAGMISLLIILVTLSYQGTIALRTNPAETLRNE